MTKWRNNLNDLIWNNMLSDSRGLLQDIRDELTN